MHIRDVGSSLRVECFGDNAAGRAAICIEIERRFFDIKELTTAAVGSEDIIDSFLAVFVDCS